MASQEIHTTRTKWIKVCWYIDCMSQFYEDFFWLLWLSVKIGRQADCYFFLIQISYNKWVNFNEKHKNRPYLFIRLQTVRLQNWWCLFNIQITSKQNNSYIKNDNSDNTRNINTAASTTATDTPVKSVGTTCIPIGIYSHRGMNLQNFGTLE